MSVMITPLLHKSGRGPQNTIMIAVTGLFRSVVTKKRREFTHAQLLVRIFNSKTGTCAFSVNLSDNGLEKPCTVN